MLLALPVACAAPEDIEDPEHELRDLLLEDETDNLKSSWSHPFQAAVGIEPLPLFEAKDAPDGRRYAVGGGFAILEDGTRLEFPKLVLLDRESDPPTEEELAAEAPRRQASGKVHRALTAKLSELDPEERVSIFILGEDDGPGLQWELEKLVARGVVEDQASWDAERDRLLESRSEEAESGNDLLSELVEDMGSETIWRCAARKCIIADVFAGDIATYEASPDVRRLYLSSEEGSVASADGADVRHAAQVKQLIDAGYDGEGAQGGVAQGDNIVVAIVEPQLAEGSGQKTKYDADHEGYRDGSDALGNPFRRAVTSPTNHWRWNCTASGCTQGNNFPSSIPQGTHQTQVAGLILGDAEDGQISGQTSAEQTASSGYAPEAIGHFFLTDGGTTVALFDIAAIASNDDPPHIVNVSARFQGDCDGSSLMDTAVNNLYKDGVATIAAAGNEGGSATSCTVGPPGTAIGAFTVGAIAHVPEDIQTPLDLREAPLFDEGPGNTQTGWGGNPQEGDNRSIVSIVAPGRRSHKLAIGGGISTTSGGLTGTSHATATVSGIAASVMDEYISTGKNWIDHPGRLYAHLLLMGDRQTLSGKGDSSPDHRWGAGRIRARMTKSGGLDAPAYFWHYSTCIDHGENYYLNLTSQALPSDVNVIKVAAFWHDKRHEVSGDVANVDLRLEQTNGLHLGSDTDPDDNKATVFYYNATGVPDSQLRLRIRGVNVSGHDGGCGNDSIMVHFNLFAEDSDRESPTYDGVSGEGIAPENI